MHEAQDLVAGELQSVRLVAVLCRGVALLVVGPAVQLDDDSGRRPQRVDLEAGGGGVQRRLWKAGLDDQIEEPLLQLRAEQRDAALLMGVEGGREALVALAVAALCAPQRPVDRGRVEQSPAIRLAQRRLELPLDSGGLRIPCSAAASR